MLKKTDIFEEIIKDGKNNERFLRAYIDRPEGEKIHTDEELAMIFLHDLRTLITAIEYILLDEFYSGEK